MKIGGGSGRMSQALELSLAETIERFAEDPGEPPSGTGDDEDMAHKKRPTIVTKFAKDAKEYFTSFRTKGETFCLDSTSMLRPNNFQLLECKIPSMEGYGSWQGIRDRKRSEVAFPEGVINVVMSVNNEAITMGCLSLCRNLSRSLVNTLMHQQVLLPSHQRLRRLTPLW